jgi:hypothetical protein
MVVAGRPQYPHRRSRTAADDRLTATRDAPRVEQGVPPHAGPPDQIGSCERIYGRSR